ncbi:hypothetical protein C8R48DRAFT_676681 [Suillus tomentosus]|nr:hypothetical protein C8R48DRAFT_676669 [Suillus tomentosus]KAG1850779.1 hypothetical protein C8R48DRAFT_676681 [Suillus tomentosus]
MSVPVIACQILAIVHSTGSGESEVVQAGLKALLYNIMADISAILVSPQAMQTRCASLAHKPHLQLVREAPEHICADIAGDADMGRQAGTYQEAERCQRECWPLTAKIDICCMHGSDSEITDAVLPVQEAQDLEVNSIGAMKDMELGITVLLKDRQVALLQMDKLERRGKSYF